MLFFTSLDPILALNNSSWSRSLQEGYYESIVWIGNNSEKNASIVSNSGSQLYFLPIIANRSFLGIFPGDKPDVVYNFLKDHRPGYVIVWNRLHPYNETYYYVDLYRESIWFKEVWSEGEVSIFKLV